MGYVYYGNYAAFYEVGRAELLRKLGFTYRTLEERGVMCPVMTFQIRYLRPCVYDELVTIKTSIRDLPSDNIVFHTEIYTENNKLANAGFIKLAFVDASSKKRCSTPQELLDLLRPHFERGS
jgi:acyl-CoA thioester hydrolase